MDTSEVFDDADQAQHQQLKELAAIQQRALALNRPETHPDFDGTHCVECGCAIPPARLAMRKVRCVDCQEELEAAGARDRRFRPAPPRDEQASWDD